MKIFQNNFLLAQIDLNGLPDLMDWADHKKIELTAILPGAVRLREVLATILPGMDGNAIIPIAKVYAKAPAASWDTLRKEWETHSQGLFEERKKAHSGLIITNAPIGKGDGQGRN